ncbi:hypothetical protein EG832_22745 [bacterium]|nr:hypothetical protein [bacterium]
MELFQVISNVFQILGVIVALVLSFIALTRDRGKEHLEGKKMCVEHEGQLKQLIEDVQKFDRIDKIVGEHSKAIAVITSKLETIQEMVEKIFNAVYQPVEKKTQRG